MFNNCPTISNQKAESKLRDLGNWYLSFISPNGQVPGLSPGNTPIRRVKLRRRIPTGYQVVSIARDGNCLFNAIMDGMINRQLHIPSAWVTQDTWTRGQSMRKDLISLCKMGYKTQSKYEHLRETLAAQGDGDGSLFKEMFYRISTGKYGQDSERELIATRYNIIIRVYDAYENRWIVNRDANPKGDRVIAIFWDRISTHYDLLIPEGDDFVSNRSRQLQNISSRCSFYYLKTLRANITGFDWKVSISDATAESIIARRGRSGLWLFFFGRTISSRRLSRF